MNQQKIYSGPLFKRTSFWALTIILLCSCNKTTQVDPPVTSLTSDNVYENDATANSVLIGIYSSIQSMSFVAGQTFNSISLVTGLSADELTLYGGAANVNTNLAGFYLNRVSPGTSNSTLQNIWNDLYSKVYTVNTAVERLGNSPKLSQFVKQQLSGEARFMRALFYFYLVNLYGDVPLVISTDYRKNSILSRASKSEVYQQIVADLKEAENLLSQNFIGADAKTISTERLRPNKYAAASLLARVYLYTGEWAKAEEQSTLVINSSFFKLTSVNNIFLKNSDEAIWQLQPVNAGWNTEDARVFILPPTGPTSSSIEGYPVYLSNQLINSFEPNDLRKINWIGSVKVNGPTGISTYYFPYKYKNATLNASVTEYVTVFRLAEQFLIRAEARAHLNKMPEGLNDLNAVRNRAGLLDASAGDQTTFLNLINHERQVELFTEWGHRWLDLKRTGKVDELMSAYTPQKGTTWSPNWALYPIPLYDITQNPNLSQNPGY